MKHGHSVKRIARAAVVLLLTLTYSALIRADNCAGGMDVTGNECSGQQSAASLSNAVPSPSKADTRIVFAKRAEALAQRRLAEAKVRQSEAAAAVKIAEVALTDSRKAVADVQYGVRR